MLREIVLHETQKGVENKERVAFKKFNENEYFSFNFIQACRSKPRTGFLSSWEVSYLITLTDNTV